MQTRKNVYTIDEILLKWGKRLLIPVAVIALGGTYVQYSRYSEKNTFSVFLKNEKGNRSSVEEVVSNSKIRKIVEKDPTAFFKKKFPGLKKATKDNKKVRQYILYFGKSSKSKRVKIKDYIQKEDKIKYLQAQYPDHIKIEKTDPEKLADLRMARVGEFFWFFILFGTLPIAFLVTGSLVRKKENKILAVLSLLERSLETSMNDIARNTDLSREFVLEAIRVINMRGLGYFVFDENTQRISDARLRTEVVLVEKCPNCGAGSSQRVNISLDSSPACQFCQTPFPIEFLNELKFQRMDTIQRNDTRQQQATAPQQPVAVATNGKPFNMGVFIFWIIFFWPVAIYYAVTRQNNFRR